MVRIRKDRYFKELAYARLFMLLSCKQSLLAPKKGQHILLLRKKEIRNEKRQPIIDPRYGKREEVESDLVAPALRPGPSVSQAMALVPPPPPALPLAALMFAPAQAPTPLALVMSSSALAAAPILAPPPLLLQQLLQPWARVAGEEDTVSTKPLPIKQEGD